MSAQAIGLGHGTNPMNPKPQRGGPHSDTINRLDDARASNVVPPRWGSVGWSRPSPRPMAWAGIRLPRCGGRQTANNRQHRTSAARNISAIVVRGGAHCPSLFPDVVSSRSDGLMRFRSRNQPNESEAPPGRPSFGHHQSSGGCPRIECSAAPLGLRWMVTTLTQADGQGWHKAATLWR